VVGLSWEEGFSHRELWASVLKPFAVFLACAVANIGLGQIPGGVINGLPFPLGQILALLALVTFLGWVLAGAYSFILVLLIILRYAAYYPRWAGMWILSFFAWTLWGIRMKGFGADIATGGSEAAIFVGLPLLFVLPTLTTLLLCILWVLVSRLRRGSSG
jgi:hypothetical protein